jgi:carboxyl-terminal processing protease
VISISRLTAGLGFAATLCVATALSACAQEPIETDNRETLRALESFAEAFTIVRDNYVTEVEDAKLIENALNGALSHLDPHSGYIPPVTFEENRTESRREYGGLGIEITQKDGLVFVNWAVDDGPAQKAGLVPGDYITHVEGVSVLGKELDDAVEGMRGEAGEAVTITVLSEGKEPREISITREIVRGRVVRHNMDDGVPYVFIQTFNNQRLTSDLENALTDLERQAGSPLPGLIIDLRSNRGGLLTESVSVSSLFLDGGEVLSVRGREDGDIVRYHAEDGERYPNMPIVVLINSGSASAAEIVAEHFKTAVAPWFWGVALSAKALCKVLCSCRLTAKRGRCA